MRENCFFKAKIKEKLRPPGPGMGFDEICWRVRVYATTKCGELTEAQLKEIWKACREVSRKALKITGDDGTIHLKPGC